MIRKWSTTALRTPKERDWKAMAVTVVVMVVVGIQVSFLLLVVERLVELVSVVPVATLAAVAVGASVMDSTAAVVVAMGSAIGDTQEDEEVEVEE